MVHQQRLLLWVCYTLFHLISCSYFSGLSDLYLASINSTSKRNQNTLSVEELKTKDLHQDMKDVRGSFGRKNYGMNHKESWGIVPEQPTSSITIHFESFETNRHRDLVKIYEGAR
jgi:hypothetical protein